MPGLGTDKGLSSSIPADGSVDDGPLGRAAASGTLWLTAQKWLVRISGLVTIAVLTRMISPSEFGVVAAASTLTPFVLVLADLGFSTFIVQSERLNNSLLSTGFWFSVAAGSVVAAMVVLGAPIISGAFGLSDATPVIRAMSIPIILTVLGSVPLAIMRRRMDFQLMAVQGIAAALLAQIVAIAFALRGMGAWALVAQLVVSQAVITLLAWRASEWVPSMRFSRVHFSAIAGFGSKVVAVDLIAAARAAAEAAIISSVLGPAALGFLNIAQRLVQVTQDLSGSALVPVSTVVFARVRQSQDRLQAAYFKALSVAYGVVSPILIFVAVGAPLLVPLIFGKGWAESVHVSQALALAAILTLGAMLDHGLHLGAGRPGRWLVYAATVDALTVAVTAITAPHGLTAVAVGFFVVALAATVGRWVVVARLLHVRSRSIAATFGRAIAAAVVSAGGGLIALVATDGLPPVASLILVAATISLLQLAMVRLLLPMVLFEVLDMVPSRLRWAPARLRQRQA